MKRLLIVLAAAGGLVLASLPLQQASAATCNTRYGTVSGGYRAFLTCSGTVVEGFGTTKADAQMQAQNLYSLYAETGLLCSGSSVDVRTAGHRATVNCRTGSLLGEDVNGYGQNLTTAMTEARELAALFARYGRLCSTWQSDARKGGYGITLGCETGSLDNTIDGFGTTFDDAAVEARALATLWSKTGRFCGTTYSDAISGGYRVQLNCTGAGHVVGTGPTLTVAARNARAAAGG